MAEKSFTHSLADSEIFFHSIHFYNKLLMPTRTSPTQGTTLSSYITSSDQFSSAVQSSAELSAGIYYAFALCFA